MKTIHNIFGWAVGVAIGLSGCATDADITLPVPGNVPIALSGIMTRGAEANDYPNLHLMAKVGAEDIYIPETAITCKGLETTNPKDITIGNVFYPIGDKEIRFFAYSGTATAGKMALTAGTERANDAILSNYGTPETVPITEGQGTPGTSKAPAEVLQFRHVMTQLNVSVVVDNAGSPVVDPVPTSIELELEGAIQKGKYSITAVSPKNPTDTTDERATIDDDNLYLIKKGTNYLVPTGAVLSGEGLFKKLKIDDYTATGDDLKGFEIGYVSGSSGALKLLPGYSYDLEFKVKRLKVTGITLKKVDWAATEIKDNDVSYTPQELVLDLGSYNNTTANEDTITKVVLYEKVETNKAKQYVGDYLHTKGLAKFVTLPPATATIDIDSVELYTSKGLLIHGAKPTGYADNGVNGKKLTLPLSVGGMLPENPSAASSESNPYLIKTALQFLNVSKNLAAHYRQAISVDMERLSNTEITPLGAMTGSYDGNGFQILHLNLKGAGLFTSNSGVLKNIRIVSGTVNGSGESSVGGICGSNTGTIVACTNQARIINAPTHAGGICGSNSGTITACLNTGNIPSGTVVGGICGENTNTATGAITACVNTGMLNRTATSLAGICGTTPDNSDTSVLKVCYWLTGTAEKNQGDTAAGSGGNDWNNNGGLKNEVGVNGVTPDNAADVADLSPQKLRNQMTAEETINTTARLNNTVATTSYNNMYHFVLDAKTTGCTWPIPVKTINTLLQ